MKRIFIYIMLCLSLLMSCAKVLDKTRHDSLADADVWNDAALTNLYLNNLYSLTLPSFGGTSNTSLCEEQPGTGPDNMMYGELTTSSSYGIFSNANYQAIRQLNVLITNIDGGSIAKSTKNPIKAQALFLRAWVYWQLVLYYGGIPLIMDVQDPIADHEALLVKRSSAKTCVSAIINDLDTAINYLPASWPGAYGRITRGAAAALKARVMLFYASPQFNPDNLKERWDSAYKANVEAKSICDADGYGLYSKFSRIFLDEGNKEAIYVTVYDMANSHHTYDANVRPRSESSSGGQTNNPTWELVKAFPMKSGLPITDPSSGYDTAYFWNNRDPRFYATIAWNGCIWGLSNQTNRRQWSYDLNSPEISNPSNTGFYCRKNIDTTRLKADVANGTPTDWIEIRYAEILLNLAECAAELGNLDEAKSYLTVIRSRAGIDKGDGSYGIKASTKETMVAAVMTERQIEFAYENKRHWDLRRRNMYINDLGPLSKINGSRRHKLFSMIDTAYIRANFAPTKKTEADLVSFFEKNMRDTINWGTNYFRYFKHTIQEVENLNINYLQPKYNFYFLPTDQINYNPALKQTINWVDADYFDPLAE